MNGSCRSLGRLPGTNDDNADSLGYRMMEYLSISTHPMTKVWTDRISRQPQTLSISWDT